MPVYVNRKRISHRSRGSFTVEAALVLPIFIFAVSVFLYLFQFIMIQQRVQTALARTTQYYAKNAYLLEQLSDSVIEQQEELSKVSEELGVENLISGVVYQRTFQNSLSKDDMTDTIIEGGYTQINIQPQGDCVDGDEIDLCAYYTCRIPVLFFPMDRFEVIQRCRVRKWTGVKAVPRFGQVQHEEEPEENLEEQYVYITETGKRYHTHEDCSHIRLSIRETSMGLIEGKRNRNNGKYKPCEICVGSIRPASGGVIYYTDYGDRYHTSSRCSGIKRTVNRVPKSQIPEGMTICQKCSRRDEANKEE